MRTREECGVTYTVVLLREPDGRYSVSVPALSGCFTWGDNIAHALQMAEEAIGLYLEVLEEDGEAVPEDAREVRLDMTEASEALVLKLSVREVAAAA